MHTEPVNTFTVGRYTVEIIPDHDADRSDPVRRVAPPGAA